MLSIIKSRFLLLVISFFWCSWGLADQLYFQNLFPKPDVKVGYIVLDYSYFDESLDVFNYSEKIDSASKPESATATFKALNLKLGSRLWMSYEQEESKGTVVREAEPLQIETRITGDSLQLRGHLGDLWGHDLYAWVQKTERRQDQLNIDCYSSGGTVVGGDCPTADFKLFDSGVYAATGDKVYLPVLTSEASEERLALGILAEKNLSSRVLLKHTLRYAVSDLDSKTTSPLFEITSPFLLGSNFQGKTLGELIAGIQADLPQSEPWEETSLRYDLGLTFNFANNWLLAGSLGYIKVSRSGYDERAGKVDYDSNIVINGSLWFAPTKGFAAYLRGELSSNYLLGIDPITYNQKTSRFFEHPYGQLSAGIVLSF